MSYINKADEQGNKTCNATETDRERMKESVLGCAGGVCRYTFEKYVLLDLKTR